MVHVVVLLRNKELWWLPFEGLARQKNAPPWTLWVIERISHVSEDMVRAYTVRLREAGCKDIHYRLHEELRVRSRPDEIEPGAPVHQLCSFDYPLPEFVGTGEGVLMDYARRRSEEPASDLVPGYVNGWVNEWRAKTDGS